MADEPGAPVSELVSPGALSALLLDIARQVGRAPELDLHELRPGAVVDRFEIVREVGRGGFGIVYEARDRALGRTVAFKVVRAGSRPDVREERLLREAEAAARLSHPNIVTLFDAGRCEQGPYLVMEMLHGETLGQRLAQGRLPLGEALRIGVEVARGLAHAHSQGVVHRDLTPGNVYLCEDGHVKVLDLGMAHAFGRRKLDGGTPAYMAPEQRVGAPEDERTDVFAFGVILFEMLAGERPFEGERALASARPAPVVEVPGEPALGHMVARMLEREPVKRPRDGGEVLAALSAFQREVERSSASGVAKARRRPWPRVRLAALVALGVLLAAGLAAGVATRSTRRAPHAPSTGPADRGAGVDSVLISSSAGRGGMPLPPGGTPYGESYGEWAVAWWKWAVAAPRPVNPVLDKTGANCAVGQNGFVWFLAGFARGTRVERHCRVPAGRALFFPVVNIVECRTPGDRPATLDDLKASVAPVEQATGLEVLVDGSAVPDISRYLVTTRVFSVVTPADNIFSVAGGTLLSPCLDEGFYLMLTPLATGQHSIAIRATAPVNSVDVTYHLEVSADR